MIEDVIVLELPMPVVVEINADLFTRMDAIASQNRRTSSCDPNTG